MNKITNFSNLKISQKQDSKVGKSSLSLSLSLSAKKILKTCFLASIVFCFSLLFLASCKQKEEIIDYNNDYGLKIDLLLEEQKVPSFIFAESYSVVSNRHTNAIINDSCIEFECPEDFLDSAPHDKYNFNDGYVLPPPHSGYYVGISLFQEEKNLLDKFDFISLLDVQDVDCSYKQYGLFKPRQDYDYIIQIESDNKDCVSYYLENSNGHIGREKRDTGETLFLQIIGESIGSTQITVKLLDNNENVILSEKFNVIVKNNYISDISSVEYTGDFDYSDNYFIYMPLGENFSLEKDLNITLNPIDVSITETTKKLSFDVVSYPDIVSPESLNIENGVFNAIIEGQYDINILVENIFGQIWSKMISVIVVPPYLVNISFSQDKIIFNGLEEQQIELKYYPESLSDVDVTFSSNNPSIVEVDEKGNLKANNFGVATISASYANGGYFKDKLIEDTYECIVIPDDFYDNEVQVFLGDDFGYSTSEIEYEFEEPNYFYKLYNGSFRAIMTGETTVTTHIRNTDILVEKHIKIINSSLTFKDTEKFSLMISSPKYDGVLEYMTDPIDGWHVWGEDSQLYHWSNETSEGCFLFLRGYGNTVITGQDAEGFPFYLSSGQAEKKGNIYCSGDILTLLNYKNVENAIMGEYCFYKLFYYSDLIEPPDLPSTNLSPYCYSEMFSNCTSLKSAPKLPANVMADGCYSRMFYHCSSLENSPFLPAKKFANKCYYGMFQGCSSLISIPKIPSPTLGSEEQKYNRNHDINEAFAYMFSRCDKLIFIKDKSIDASRSYTLPDPTGLTTNCFKGFLMGTSGDYSEYTYSFEEGEKLWTNAIVITK